MVENKRKQKVSTGLIEWIYKFNAFFFMMFFIIYIGKFGISNLILEGGSKWAILFNIGVWYVLVMYCIDMLFHRKRNHNG